MWPKIRFLLISLKFSEIAGKLTPANPNFWSTIPPPYKSISCCLLVHLLLSFCAHSLETSLTCPEKGFCQQPLFFWNVLLGSGDKDFVYFPSGPSNIPIAFLSSASLIHKQVLWQFIHPKPHLNASTLMSGKVIYTYLILGTEIRTQVWRHSMKNSSLITKKIIFKLL